MLLTAFTNLRAKSKPKLSLGGFIFTLKNEINKVNKNHFFFLFELSHKMINGGGKIPPPRLIQLGLVR